MTLKIGRFPSASEAVRFGQQLGIDGHIFKPVRENANGRYTLHFGEFTQWKDAIRVMEAIRAKKLQIDLVVWPIPGSGTGSQSALYPI